jgi:hypothetical protein
MTANSVEIDELLRRPAITPKETLAILPLGRNAVYEAIKRGEIESFRVGNRIFVPTAALRRKLGIEGG